MESFNNPYIDKLVGISIEQKELEQQWHEYIISYIETIGGRKIEDFEIAKTEKDIGLISFTELAVDKILERYGRVKQIHIPINNIHVLKKEEQKNIQKEDYLMGLIHLPNKAFWWTEIKTISNFQLPCFMKCFMLNRILLFKW